MTQPFSLHCLGSPRLVAPDGRPVRLKTRKHLALLVYLAVEPHTRQSRDRLTTLLWDSTPGTEGRHSLATAVSVLRAKLGREAIEGGRDWIQLVDDHLSVDLDRLARGEVLPTDLMPALDVGGFLEDFDIPDARDFAHWRDRQRARWQPRIGDALASLMDRCRRTGDFKEIERYADRMLQLDELNEEGIRGKMEARAFAGDRLSALKVYEAWRSRLEEELAAVPSPLLSGIAVRLRHRGLERQNTSQIASVPTDQWKNRPFVGRAVEYRRMYEAWEDSLAGTPTHCLVVGDSGVGKSTVLHRLATAAGLEGAAPVRAQGHALEQKVPYAAVGMLVEQLIDLPGASCTEPVALADLSQVITRVGDRFPRLPQVPSMRGEAARIRLAESVERLLYNVAEEQPVVLVVDDLHHADDASVAVLHLLMRKLADRSVMIVAAARIAELAELPSGRRLTEAAAGIHLGVLELGPLSTEESESLIDTLIPDGEPCPDGTARQAVLRAGAGFPMALELLVSDWRIHGDQCLALSLDAMTEDVSVGDMPSHTYRRSFERIYHELDPLTRNVLNLSAVLGARLHDPRMYGLADLSLGQMMTGLTRLTELRVLRDGGRQLEFINELIRGQAYLAIPSPLRRVLHAGIADRLLGDDGEGRDAPGLEIAWHLIRAGRGSEATGFLLRGAQVAVRHGAPNEAERALSSAMEHLKDPERSEAVILLAESLQEQGKLRESLEVLDRLPLSNSRDLAMRRVVLRAQAQTTLEHQQDSERQALLRDMVSIASSDEQSIARAQALNIATAMLDTRSDCETRRAVENALASFKKEALSPEETANIARAQARLLYLARDMAGARHELISAIDTLKIHKVCSSVFGSLYLGLGAIECATGHYEDAISAFHSSYKNTQRLADGWLAPTVCSNLALCYGRIGEYKEQGYWARRAIELSVGRHRADKHLKACYFLAFSEAMIGHSEVAIRTIDKGEKRYGLDNVDLQWWGLRRADILYICGENNSAIESATSALSIHTDPTGLGHAGAVARWLAQIVVNSHISLTIKDKALSSIGTLATRLDELDVMDRIEVLSAQIMVGASKRLKISQLRNDLDAALAPLPPTVSVQLERLGASKLWHSSGRRP